MTPDQALERIKKGQAYVNNYNKTHYERIATTYPLGTKERIQASGDSLNNFVKTAVMEKLERMGL